MSDETKAPIENGAVPALEAPPVSYRWLALFCVSLPMFANYYIYDSINPLTDIFEKQLGFTDEHIGWLNSSYSVAAVLTLLIGGLIIDRLGTRPSIVLFSVICLAGAVVTELGGSLTVMLLGRFVLGLGAESLIVAITTAIAKWFKRGDLGFAYGVNLTIARLASVAADKSPGWAKFAFYPDGTPPEPSWRGPILEGLEVEPSWRGPLLVAVGAGIIGIVGAAVYWWLERGAQRRYALGKAGQVDKLELSQLFRFDRSYWFIVGLCFAFYSGIFPFRTFAIKFFMHTHFADLPEDAAREVAGNFNGNLPLAAMIATPLFGLLVDKVGRRALFMMVGSLVLTPVYLLMAYSDMTLWVPMTLMGISFSLIPAVMWPSVAYTVDEKRLGSAYALMTLIQQIGMIALNWLIGVVNDAMGAGAQNPQGYALGMWIFSGLGFIGLFFAIKLWQVDRGLGARGLSADANRAAEDR